MNSPGAASSKRPRINLVWLFLPTFLAALVVGGLLWHRSGEKHQLNETTQRMATPTVNVVAPQAGPSETEIVLPGNLTAFSEAPIYARTSGYLKSWAMDIGAKVTEGQVMAEIDAPDVDAQLRQANATLAQAKANLEIANLNFDRQKDLLQKKVASQQEYDQNRTNVAAMEAGVQAGEANVQNLTVQQNFQKLRAPFTGYVTRRNTDVGALINGSGGGSMNSGQELFRIARTDILRAYIYVPQIYSSSVKRDTSAYLEFSQHPGERFEGKIVSISGAMDPATRTLLTEVQVPNAQNRLFPGAYASVHLKLTLENVSSVIPVNTLLFRSQGTQVGVVDAAGVVHLKKVVIGHDFGTTVEITGGLDPQDRIIVNPSDSLSDGDKVLVQATPPADDAKKS